ncbi:FtsQ-type POTRA domain-containing protein [Nocardioides sp. W3-2-3]|uniref:cell division protein FtsQ/DivIB n=1 Tax=Nocardioides convexus TaxID=2712224 RepID=UPI002418881F|nr:FtsQ-type POTRA domain-containing protein [Nocardioides convexus]NGZ99988.1 FtsQ-type POTRA domain-containing protein [Nocardioides convexus]
MPTGGPLVRVDLDAIEKRVKSLSAVKDVDVSRKWPHDVRIEIVERKPIAVLDLGTKVLALDADGTSFAAPARKREGLPRIRVGSGADKDALREGAAVVAALSPEVARLVDHVEVRTIDEIQTAAARRPEGRVGERGQARRTRPRCCCSLLKRKAQEYDVSVPGAPTTR